MRKEKLHHVCGVLLGALLAGNGLAAPHSPDFGPNVAIIDSSMSADQIQAALMSASNEAEFGTGRHAVLFKPGVYNLQAPVGYYESIAGLGKAPGAVTINGFLTPNFGSTPPWSNVTDVFWRSMENMSFNPVPDTAQHETDSTLQWGVSQAAPLRRVQINGGLELTDTWCGQASGGFLADSVVTGQVSAGTSDPFYRRGEYVRSRER